MITCLIACWPLTFGVYSVKNDALHYFLPYRYNIAEALRHGEFPFWSPYIYQGYPVYGDMQSGAWNPVVWVLSLFGRYDLTTFHWENLLYVFLAGAGMYKLTYYRCRHALTALFAGMAYMLSGFLLSGQLINWLAAAACIPFVMLYYWKTAAGRSYADAIKTGVALWLLFVAGYPSFFIITAYGLVAMFVARLVTRVRDKQSSWGRWVLQHAVVAAVFGGLALPAIISFADLLPYYQRGGGTPYAEAVHNSLEWQHVLSLLFPSAIHATDVVSSTDVTCRNLYLGILVLPVIIAFPPRRNAVNMALVLVTVFAFLFSLGDATPFRKLAYDYIPYMDTFRHPSQARLFVIAGLLLLAAPGIKRLLDHPSESVISHMFNVTLVFSGCVLLITLIALTQSGLPAVLSEWKGSNSGIKQFIESTSMHDVVLINGIVQLLTLGLTLFWLKRKTRKPGSLVAIAAINLVILAQFILPVTFVSQTSPSEINTVIRSYPPGFPAPDLSRTLAENSRDLDRYFEKMGSLLFYNKKPGISRLTNTPSFLTQQDSMLAKPYLYDYIAIQPVAYLAGSISPLPTQPLLPASLRGTRGYPAVYQDSNRVMLYLIPDTLSAIGIKKWGAHSIHLQTESSGAVLLALTQSHHKYWRVYVDDIRREIMKVNIAFMAVDVPRGKHVVRFEFVPVNTIRAMWVQGATMLVLLIFSGVYWWRSKIKSKSAA